MAVPAKCFLVTGSPGVGKTTLISKILETLKSSNPNFKDITEGLMGPVVMTPTPDGNLNYNDLLHATSKLYQKLYPDDEFFPATSNTDSSDKLEDDSAIGVES